ncbi:hypothetical protein FQN50_001656 [Emmonsiellopsis sp. PD_5]|nr:hypothetical protein FQN50_001656 [Emmonsiellopsis sp. PD_5]
MSAGKPSIVFIPGGWHTPDYYDDVRGLLKELEYETHAVHLPTVGQNLLGTPIDDAAHIQETTRTLVDAGKDVVLVMHSYGAFPGTLSAEGLAKRDRLAQGKPGGVLALIYISGFIAPEGKTLGEAFASFEGGAIPDWMVFEDNCSKTIGAQDILYHDSPPSQAAKFAAKLLPHSRSIYTTPLTYPGYKHVSATYILCTKDRAIPLATQKAMVAALGEGLVNTETFHSGHSPMLSMPEKVTEVILKAAGGV